MRLSEPDVRAERLARLEEKKLRTLLEEEDRVESIERRAKLDEVKRDLRIEDVNNDMRRAAQLNAQRQGLIEMRRSTARDAQCRDCGRCAEHERAREREWRRMGHNEWDPGPRQRQPRGSG